MPYCDSPDCEPPSPLLIRLVSVFTRVAVCPFKRAASNLGWQKRDRRTARGEGDAAMLHSLIWLQPFILQSFFSFCKKSPPIAPLGRCHTGGAHSKGCQPGQGCPSAHHSHPPMTGCPGATQGWGRW